jgi:hypothetical protein
VVDLFWERHTNHQVVSLTYNDSRPTVLIGAPILDDAENVSSRFGSTCDANAIGRRTSRDDG